MRTTRTMAAVLVVATTLGVERAGAAWPEPVRLESEPVVRGLAGRLAASFQRTLPAPRLEPARLEGRALNQFRPIDAEPQFTGPVAEQTPFFFRLPPPRA